LLQQAQPTTDDVTAVDLSADARLFLGEAAKSKTGEIVRHDLDQALVIQVNGQSFTAAIGEGKRRAELEGGVSDLERLGLIEDVSGKRTVFALTRKGYSIAET
jgi:hypothetical protein